MKNLLSASTLAGVFLVVAVTGIHADHRIKNKGGTREASAPSVSEKSAAADEGCCPGRCCPPEQTGSDAAASSEVTAPRDAASGQATGKRQHKPLTITKELDKSTPLLSKDAGTPPATVDEKATTSEGCCPGRCCPPEQTSTNAAGTSSAEIECPPGTVPSGSAGCVPQAQGMAINEKGLPGGKSTKDTKKKDSK